MLEKYESAASEPVGRAAAYINEAMDTIRTVAALGREAEIMRTFDSAARSDQHRNKFLMLGALGFAEEGIIAGKSGSCVELSDGRNGNC